MGTHVMLQDLLELERSPLQDQGSCMRLVSNAPAEAGVVTPGSFGSAPTSSPAARAQVQMSPLLDCLFSAAQQIDIGHFETMVT